MDSDKITQELNQRFAAPLPEFYKRRIVFWYDEDREFWERLDEVALNHAKMVALTGTNNFAVKKLLAVDDTTNNYLVYCPLSYEKPEDNWLLDIEMYSEEFRADLISIWMDELGIPSTPAMRKQVKDYRKYFNAKTRRVKIASQSKAPTVPARRHRQNVSFSPWKPETSPAAKLISHAMAIHLPNPLTSTSTARWGINPEMWAPALRPCSLPWTASLLINRIGAGSMNPAA